MEYDDVNNTAHQIFLLGFDQKCDPLSLRNVAYGVYTNCSDLPGSGHHLTCK